MGNPLPLNLAQEARKAEKILSEFVDPAHGGLDRVIPMSVLRRAQGLAIFSVARVGIVMSARVGSGVVIARLQDDSWSAPSALGLGGIGGGFVAGVDVTDFVIVLNSRTAVRTFMATGNLQLGGNLAVAVGPLGRSAEASGAVNSSGNIAAIFSYSKSKGLYGGVSIEGTVLVDRSDANSKTYHRSVTAKEILSGSVEVPTFAEPLIRLIEKFTLSGEVRTGLEGKSASARGYGYYGRDGQDERDDDIDKIDRDLQNSRISSRTSPAPLSYSPSSRNTFDDEDRGYNRARRSPEYAFGSAQGRSTNSPTKTRTSFLGGRTTSVPGVTDYSGSKGGNDNVFDSSSGAFGKSQSASQSQFNQEQGSFARAGVQLRKNAAPEKYLYGQESERASYRAAGRNGFATTFQDSSWDDDADQPQTQYTSNSSSQQARDPFSIGDEDDDHYTSYSSKPNAAQYRGKSNDYIDGNINGSNKYSDRNLIDLDDDYDTTSPWSSKPKPPSPSANFSAAYSSSSSTSAFGAKSGSRRNVSGMDSLDKELQQRSSMSSTDDDPDHDNSYFANEKGRRSNGTPTAKSGWRSDYGLPDDDFAAPLPQEKQQANPQRPMMHHRTSSAQKLWNRVRGNSQSASRSAFADSWEARYGNGTPSPSTTPRPASGASVSRSTKNYRTPSPNLYGGSRQRATPPPAATFAEAMAIARTGSAASSTQQQQSGSLGAIPTTVELQVLAKFDFEGQEEHDLSFKRGDVIDILRRTDSREDWWLGRIGVRIGNLPANFTEDI